jgi:hypothetical protein
MAYSTTKLGRLAVKTQAAWLTEETSFATTDYIEAAKPFIPNIAQEALRTDTYRADYTEPTIVGGSTAPTEWQIPLSPLHGWSASEPIANPGSTINPDLLLLSRCLGGLKAGDGYTTSVSAAQSTTSVIAYTDGTADAAWEGHAQLYDRGVIGWLANVNTAGNPDTGTLIAAMAVVPDDVGAFGSHVAYLTNTFDLSPLTVQWLGSNANEQIRLSDVSVPRFRIVAEAKKQPMWEATLRGITSNNVNSGGAPAAYAYGFPQMPAFIGTNGARCYYAGVATSFQSVSVEITQDTDEVANAASAQGVAQYLGTNRRVVVTVRRVVADIGDITAAPGDSAGVLQFDLNTTPGRACSILVPAAVYLDKPTITDIGGVYGVEERFGCALYTSDDSSTAPADTPFRIAFL